MKMKLKTLKHMDEKPSGEHFDGFQTVRAVGRDDRFISGLATPEFATYIGNMMRNETRTEYVLKLANNQLKRALSSDHNTCTQQETTKVNHNRTTLSELFQRTKIDGEETETKSKIGEHNEEKTDNNSVRKILKRFTTSSDVSGSNDEKLHKILQMIHLEAVAISQNMRKYVKKSQVADEQDIMIFPYSANQTKSKKSYAATNRKRERWIKSDAEYLILEL